MGRIALLLSLGCLLLGAAPCNSDDQGDEGGDGTVAGEGNGNGDGNGDGDGDGDQNAGTSGEHEAGRSGAHAGNGSGNGSGDGDGNNDGNGDGDGDGDDTGVQCGNNTCAPGEPCCNESCGICGDFCTQQECVHDAGPIGGDDADKGVECGKNVCAAGEECCNSSCGYCTAPGEGCTKELCTDDPKLGPFCGGFAGFPCPGAGVCVDDPRDDCDPDNGGADCGGVCECPPDAGAAAFCNFDSSPEVCGCVDGDGERCGKVVCPSDEACCNASCSMCAPPDHACIQIACD